MTLGEIERLTLFFSMAWSELKHKYEDLELARLVLMRKHIYGIKSSLEKAKEKKATLIEAILLSPELFEDPRTYLIHGMKVGLKKSKGELSIENPDKTLTLIKKHFPGQVDLLINTKESPAKAALMQLSPFELKKIGAQITNTCDKPVVTTTDSDLEKLVAAFMKEGETKIEVA